ncbi:MAG: hypothetical protein U1F43_23535 [Myxococcota bacterium]
MAAPEGAEETGVPALPPAPRRLAQSDDRVREAVEIRERIADYARRKDIGLDRVVVLEVDELLVTMVELATMRRELEAHLAGVSPARMERDAGLLDAGTLEGQRQQLADLRTRCSNLEAELARAVAGLRETWLGLLDALATPGAGSLAASRTREQVEGLRLRIAAEKEARRDVNEPA